MNELQRIFDLNFDAYLHGPELVVLLAALGLAVGVLTGLFGVGGAFVITPLLKVAFGIPYELAIGSSLCFTIGTASSGMARHMRMRNFEPRCVLVLGLTSIAGAVAGATLNKFLRETLGEHDYTLMMHVLFIVILTATALLVARNKADGRSGRSLLQRLPVAPYIDLPAGELSRVSLPGLCALGVGIGVLQGMMGIGGGVLLMPLLILVVGLTAHQAVGTSLGVILFGSTAGTIKYGLDGSVNMWVAMGLLVGSVFGVQIGAMICRKLHGRRLRRYFAILVLLVVAALVADLAHKLAG